MYLQSMSSALMHVQVWDVMEDQDAVRLLYCDDHHDCRKLNLRCVCVYICLRLKQAESKSKAHKELSSARNILVKAMIGPLKVQFSCTVCHQPG